MPPMAAVGGNGRSGNRRKEHAGEDIDHRQTARKMPQQSVGEVNHPLAHAALEHQLAGQHEKGNRDQRNRIGSGKHPLHHDQRGKAV